MPNPTAKMAEIDDFLNWVATSKVPEALEALVTALAQ
jgi:hypothetical protein